MSFLTEVARQITPPTQEELQFAGDFISAYVNAKTQKNFDKKDKFSVVLDLNADDARRISNFDEFENIVNRSQEDDLGYLMDKAYASLMKKWSNVQVDPLGDWSYGPAFEIVVEK